jgi:hypothetical protein
MPDATIQLTAVFEVVADIEEIGAVAGDRIVVRPDAPWRPYALVRPLSHAGARWVFGERCRLLFTDPPSPRGRRRCREAWRRRAPRHLRLVE